VQVPARIRPCFSASASTKAGTDSDTVEYSERAGRFNAADGRGRGAACGFFAGGVSDGAGCKPAATG